MDQSEIPLRTQTSVVADGMLEPQVRSLRGTVTMLLIACCCLGAGLALYLYRQVTQLNVQVVEAKRTIDDYQTNALPRIKWFVGNLQAFAKTNADFNPILAKYGLLPTNAANPAAAAPAAPAPAASKK